MNRFVALSVVLQLLLLLTACVESGFDTGYWTSDAAYMQQFKEHLEEASIPFTVDNKGQVSWSVDHAKAVLEIRMNLERQLYGGRAVRFGSEDSNRYFRKLLDERNLEYFEEQRSDGDWTRWYPEHKAQADELHQLVMMFEIEKVKAAASTKCNKALPSARPAAETSVAAKDLQTPPSC